MTRPAAPDVPVAAAAYVAGARMARETTLLAPRVQGMRLPEPVGQLAVLAYHAQQVAYAPVVEAPAGLASAAHA